MFRAMLMVAALAFSTAASAQHRNDAYDVQVTRTSEQVLKVQFRSERESDTTCRRVLSEVRVKDDLLDEGGRVHRGAIGLDTKLGECNEEPGFHYGSIGLDLEQLTAGRYFLFIDGHLEGRLRLNDDGTVDFRQVKMENAEEPVAE